MTSHWSIVLTLYLWTLSSSQWRCQPGRFSMAAHRHDRRGIYRCVLLSFRGRIEIDHSYSLRCRSLCCHSRRSTRVAGRGDRKRPRDDHLHSCCAGSGSTNHSSADRIVVNSYNQCQSTQQHNTNTYWVTNFMISHLSSIFFNPIVNRNIFADSAFLLGNCWLICYLGQ